MARDPDTVQPTFPGLDVEGIERQAKKTAYEDLMKNNPKPDTKKEAMKFLRRHTVTTITMKSDHDDMRVVLKQKNASEDKEKHEWNAELNPFDQDACDAVLIDYAIKAWYQWTDLETPKYRT